MVSLFLPKHVLLYYVLKHILNNLQSYSIIVDIVQPTYNIIRYMFSLDNF